MYSFWKTYDESLEWSGFISSKHHWSAVGWGFVYLLGLITFAAIWAAIGMAVRAPAPTLEGGLVLGFVLGGPLHLMLFLSSVRRGRGAGIPGALTACVAFFAWPVVAVLYGLLPNNRAEPAAAAA